MKRMLDEVPTVINVKCHLQNSQMNEGSIKYVRKWSILY